MKLSERMKRSRFITEDSKVILHLNAKDIESDEDFLDINVYAQTIVQKMRKRSMYLLLDTRGMRVTSRLCTTIEKIISESTGYFKAAAVITDANTQVVMMSIVANLSLRKMQICRDAESAHEYLRAA